MRLMLNLKEVQLLHRSYYFVLLPEVHSQACICIPHKHQTQISEKEKNFIGFAIYIFEYKS